MSTTSLIARQCRLREWAQMVQNCRNRPEEMSIDEWCESNGITIRVTDRTSTELLAKVLGVIAHVNDATCFKQVYIVCGYTDLRSGIDKLTAVIDAKTGNSHR